jgi:PHD/YefM family antitoxin component YafN of YafNO toxin-antitoxin module
MANPETPRTPLAWPAVDELDEVSTTHIARNGSAALRTMLETDRPLAVTLNRQTAWIAISRQQYEALRAQAAAGQRDAPQGDDPLLTALSERFDELCGAIAGQGAQTHEALFGSPASLAESYAPGLIEREP